MAAAVRAGRIPAGVVALTVPALALAMVATIGAGTADARDTDPAYSVDDEQLDASLDCPEFAHPEHEPVLLVHGTFTAGHEQFDWNYLQVLPPMGYDVCVVTYPDRGLGDQQVSAEYVAHAVLAIHEATGQPVDLVGHSQGASMPRWAVRFWPSVRAALDDYVGIAGPYHGTNASPAGGAGGPMPEALFQFRPDARFTTILNEGDETPGELDWTNLYSEHDELVQPVEPEPTAALDFGQQNPSVANILLQDLCPGRVVDHLTIGTTDRLTFDLVVDALSHDGPADPARLDLGPQCSIADQVVEDPEQVTSLADLLQQGAERGVPDLHLATEEPATRDYARSDQQDGAPTGSSSEEPSASPDPARTAAPAADPLTAPAPIPVADTAASATGGGLAVLPATGGGAVLAGLGVLTLALAARRSRRDHDQAVAVERDGGPAAR